MIAFLSGSGFLGTKAPLGADLSLVIMVAAAVLFTVGWRMAVRKDFEGHRRIMAGAVSLNAIVVAVWMIRSFILYVLPQIPSKLNARVYAVETVHAAVGVIGVILGVFIVLRVNDLVPRSLRFKNYKAWMLPAYAIYMLGTLGGVIVYLVAYGGH